MKKTFLVYASVLFTTICLAQTGVQNQQRAASASKVQKEAKSLDINSASSASSATSIQSNAADKIEKRSTSELAAKKEAAATTLQSANDKYTQLSNQEVTVGASAASGTDVKTGENQAQASNTITVNSGTTVSLAQATEKGIEVKKEVVTGIRNKTNATIESTVAAGSAITTALNNTMIETNKQASASVSNGAKAAGSVKAKPAPVKVRSQVNTNAIINLK